MCIFIDDKLYTYYVIGQNLDICFKDTLYSYEVDDMVPAELNTKDSRYLIIEKKPEPIFLYKLQEIKQSRVNSFF